MPPNTALHIETTDGDLVPVRVAEGFNPLVGTAQREVARAPGSTFVTLLDGDRQLQPQLVDVDFIVSGRDLLDARVANRERQQLIQALRSAQALWGAGPYEGLYLPLLAASPNPWALDKPEGLHVLPYSLVPASVRHNGLEDGWIYPVTDSVNEIDASSAFYAEESEPGAPIIAFTPASRWTAPVGFSRAPQGTMYVGGLSQDLTWSLGELGTPITQNGVFSEYGIGVFYSQGQYRAHVGLASLPVAQDAAGGYGYLTLWALSWLENGRLSLSGMSRDGFQDYGSVAIGEVESFFVRKLWAGTRIDNVGVNGFVMPGAPLFGAPFFTHRVHSVAEKRAALEPWFIHVARDVYIIPPPPFSLSLTIDTVPDAVVGRAVQIPLIVERGGGFLGEIEFEVVTPDPSLRYQEIVEGEDTYTLILVPEEGIAPDTYSIKVTVRAVGQQTSAPLAAVIDSKTINLTVRLGDPALPENTTGFNAMYDARGKSFVEMAKNEVGTTGLVQLGGLARWTAPWDGIYCDGTNIAPYGPSIAWIDTNLEMGADHSVSAPFWDVPSMSVNTVLMTFSSRTLASKLHYWQVYKASDGVRIKTLLGTSTTNSGQALPIVGGVMDISVVREGANLTLQNPKTEDSVTVGAAAWVGLGRQTFFGAKLADGTVQGLSKGTVLGTARQNRAVSMFQLERQAEYMRGFMLRTAQWARKEPGDGVSHIWLADTGGVLRNYHPATADKTMISKGSGAVTQSGSFVTNGADETGWRTGWLTGTDAAKPTDVVVVMDDMNGSSGGDSKAQIGFAMYNEQNNYIRTSANSNTGSSRRIVALMESVQGRSTAEDLTNSISLLGKQAFVQRFDAVNRRTYLQHLGSGKRLIGEWDSYPYSGPIQVSIGCSHRGLSSTGTVRGDSSTGLEHEIAAKCLGIIVAARHQSAAELVANAESISETYDYSQAPIKGQGSGGSTPPPTGGTITVAASDVSPIAIASGSFSANTLFGTSGTLRTLYDRLVPQLTNGGYGNQANTPMYPWTDTSKSFRGQYHIARQFGMAGTNIYFAICATKDLRWAKQAQALWNNARAAFDRNSKPESATSGIYDGWGYGTMPSGAATDSSYGKRIKLEAGVAAQGMVNAYVMHVNSHLDSSFATSVTQMTNWWDNHYTKEWDVHYGSSTTGTEPLYAKKSFTHTVWAEMAGGLARAKIRSGAAWASDPEGVDIINAFGRWYQSHTTVVIPVADFRDAAWASYGPARLWGQRAKGWSDQASSGQFSQPQTYLNRTWGCMTFLYLEGFITHVLGSKAAADNFMAEVVSGANLGVWVEPLRAKRQVTDAINGMLAAADHPSGVLAPWMYITNPMGSTETSYQSEDKILKSYAPFMALDSSNRLQTIFDDVLTRYSSARSGENADYVGGNITRIFSEVYKNGRKG